ncbi:protein kinase [candidate division GN15 bacterium]|nr:protein kinase [candidate division GN15 bacterium]
MSQEEPHEIRLSLSPEMVVKQYRLESRIGAGGMGEIWLARDKTLDRYAALKFPSREAYAGSDAYNQMLAEARSVAALNHPNIVTVHEVGDVNGHPFIAMSYVRGKTLQTLARKQRIPVKSIVELGAQIADALAAAHSHGIVHRDLKPANVIVDEASCPHVLDFGLAVPHDESTGSEDEETATVATPRYAAAGTPHYMAPEQLAGGEAGPRTDIFALGIMLYEMTYGTHPFRGDSVSDLYRNVLADDPVSTPEATDDIPYDLTRIIRRCLEKNPERRFQTAKDVRNELRDLERALESGSAYEAGAGFAAGKKGDIALREVRLPVTADMVRELEFQSPKMIGDSLAYLDNGRFSDTLVIYLHAWGLDFRQCVDFLKAMPFRGIAPTLYGFGEHAAHRFPLRLNDHSILLRHVLQQVQETAIPQRVILAGHSSGADHVLHLLTSDDGPGIDVTGALLFGCNTSLASCFISEKFANLKDSNPEGLLGEIKKIAATANSLGEWLKLHEYLVTILSKFGENADPLRAYGADLVAPFAEHDWRQFAAWCRQATSRLDHVRFVFDPDEFDSLDHILTQHLKDNVLGDRFRESTIVREDVSHVELADSKILLKHTLRMTDEMKDG